MLNKEKIGPLINFEQENKEFYKKFEEATGVSDAEKTFFFNEDSVIQVIGKVIFMSVHLSSKK